MLRGKTFLKVVSLSLRAFDCQTKKKKFVFSRVLLGFVKSVVLFVVTCLYLHSYDEK